MPIITSQQIQNYYNLYKSIDVTFTREVVHILRFKPEQMFLKMVGDQLPCLLYSTSMESAKVILNLKTEQIEKLRNSSQGSLRFGFLISDKNVPLYFFVNIKVKGYSHYSSSASPDVYFMTLEFTQRPNDDFISLLGEFLEANVNSHKRKDERISVNENVIHKIGFTSCSTTMLIEDVERKCLIRDLSFAGARLLIPGEAVSEGTSGVLKLTVEDNNQQLLFPGKFTRIEFLENRQDIFLAGLMFDQDKIPLPYKIMINDFFKQLRRHSFLPDNDPSKQS